MEEQITIYAIDCSSHDYWKVPIELLCELNIVEEISGYSYIGTGSDPLNEQGYAYLEIDSDVGIFDKASDYYKKNVVIDMDTLTDAFNEKYDSFHEWLEELTPWDTDYLDEEGYMWDVTPEELKAVLYPSRCEECGEYECMCEEE